MERVAGRPWLERRVLAYAHRGGAREAPSSTLGAMAAALAAGASALEVDVHATSDGELVCCHDATVDRTSDGHGAIVGMSLAEVKALDAAYWFVPGEEALRGRPPGDYPLRGRAPADGAYTIPTLSEVLEAFPGVLLNLDIKQGAPAVPPYEGSVARMLERFGRVDDVIVTSFDDSVTAAFSGFAPDVPTAPGMAVLAQIWQAVRDGAPLPQTRHAAIQVPVEMGGVAVLDEALVAAAHGAGLAVHAWTIDDPAQMESLVALGVDGIMSDVPTVLCEVLERLGAAWRC